MVAFISFRFPLPSSISATLFPLFHGTLAAPANDPPPPYRSCSLIFQPHSVTPQHGEICIKPHNKVCVQPAWPCYWQNYNGDRDLWERPGECLRNCTLYNSFLLRQRQRSSEGERCNGSDLLRRDAFSTLSGIINVLVIFDKINVHLFQLAPQKIWSTISIYCLGSALTVGIPRLALFNLPVGNLTFMLLYTHH